MICWESSEEGTSSPGAFVALTNYFLVALWRTRCNKPRLDAVVFCFFNRRCYRVFNFIPWMRQKFTNPAVLLPLQTHIEIYRYVFQLPYVMCTTTTHDVLITTLFN